MQLGCDHYADESLRKVRQRDGAYRFQVSSLRLVARRTAIAIRARGPRAVIRAR